MRDTEAFRRRLLDERREILRRADRMEDELVELRGSVDTELEERAQEDVLSHLALSLDERSREELIAVDTALERIARGEYWRCEVCGEPIPRARLEALPTATTHVECAAGWEPGTG